MRLHRAAESTQRLSAVAKERRSEVPWAALAGLRNELLDAYLGIDLDQIKRAIEQDMPRLKAACQSLLEDLTNAD